MAMRAATTFHAATDDGTLTYVRDQVVPAKVAKGRDELVYDDSKAKPEPKLVTEYRASKG